MWNSKSSAHPMASSIILEKKLVRALTPFTAICRLLRDPPRMSRHILLLSDMIYSVLQRSSSIKTDRLQRFAKNTLSITITFVTTESLIREKNPHREGFKLLRLEMKLHNVRMKKHKKYLHYASHAGK